MIVHMKDRGGSIEGRGDSLFASFEPCTFQVGSPKRPAQLADSRGVSPRPKRLGSTPSTYVS